MAKECKLKTIIVHLDKEDTKRWYRFCARFPAVEKDRGRIKTLLEIAEKSVEK